MENKQIGAVSGTVGFIIGLLAMMNSGLTITTISAASLAGLALIVTIIGGSILYDFLYEDVVSQNKMWAGTLVLLFGILTVLALPFFSTTYGDAMGYGAMTEEEAPPEAAFPSYMRGTVVDALSSPTTAISGADIAYYDVEPTAGAGNVALYTDNTDSSGSFMTEIKEDAGTLLWATASSSGYYSEKDKGTTGASGSKATNIEFDDYGKGLTKIGTFSKRITNAEPSDNISIDGSGNIELENKADSTFTFDVVIETSASETALRDLLLEAEEGSAYDNEGVEMEVIQTEDPDYGTLSANLTGGQYVWDGDSTETVIQCDGDLQYRKDLVIRFTIDSDDATTGTIVNFEEVNDLSGDTGIEGEDGIGNQSFSIETV